MTDPPLPQPDEIRDDRAPGTADPFGASEIREAGGRTEVSSGGPYEEIVGYVRAVRVGPHVHVAGTTATGSDGAVVAEGDAYGQARYVFWKIRAALAGAGAGMEHVVRTRMFVTDISRWEEIARAHGEHFAGGGPRPVATLVQVAALIDPAMLVEIEAEAYVIAQ